MDEKITLINFMEFTAAQLDKLRAVSPRLEVHQLPQATFDEVPEPLRQKAEILYGWGKQLDQAHRYPRLKWIQTHSAGVNYLFDLPIWHSPVITCKGELISWATPAAKVPKSASF